MSIVLITILMLTAFTGSAFGAEKPVFPACANPQGQLKVSYDNGVHGVVGDSNAYAGKDSVYNLSNGNATQCLCPVSGNGIQTNWMKVNQMSEEEISVYVKDGWKYITDGSSWGLDQGPYLAQNLAYSCTSSSSSSSSSSDSKVGGASATNPNSVFSLANTGNMLFIVLVFLLGLALIVTGVISSLRRKV